MSAPKPEHWASPDEPNDDGLDNYRQSKGQPEPLPTIPDAASKALVAAVVSVQTAQHNLASTVGLVLATLGLSLDTHDIIIEDGRAVVVERPA